MILLTHVLSCFTSCVDVILCQAGLKPCWTRDGHFLYKWNHSCSPWFSPIFLAEVVKGRGKANTETHHILGKPSPLPKSSREYLIGRCIILCWCYKILNTKLDMTRKQFIIHIFLHVVDKTCICGHHQQSTKTTFETVIENQCSWHDGWYRLMSNDVTNIK